MMRLRRRKRVGVVISPDRLIAVLPDGRVVETLDIRDLRQFFADLRSQAGPDRRVVTVALVPPLAELRILSLPPMQEEERRRVLTRDARRHFVGMAEPVVIGTRRVGPRVLAVAAQESLVSEIDQAASAAGWSLTSIVPAAAAWAAGASRSWPERATGHVVARLGSATEVLRLDSGAPVERRRFRATEAGRAQAATLVEESAAAGRVTTLEGPELEPLTFAARHAWSAAGPELVSASRRLERHRMARRVVIAASVATAACLLLVGALDYWGLSRRLAGIRGQRAALQPQVTAAMAGRDSLAEVANGLAGLRQLEATAPRWSMFVADLADYLPRDAHLFALRAAGDSVVLEGVAGHAVGVFQGIQVMPSVAGVRAIAPIRQESAANGTVHEQFALGATLHQRSAQ